MKVTHIGLSKITNTLHLYREDGSIVPHFYEDNKWFITRTIAQLEAWPNHGWATRRVEDQVYIDDSSADDYTKVTIEEFFKEEQ